VRPSKFMPNHKHMLAVMRNERPARLPLYEHIISPNVMEYILGEPFAELHQGDSADLEQFFAQYCRFFEEMTYDTVSYEVGIAPILPGHGAIMGGKGPVQNRRDFESYPWDEIPERFWTVARPRFDALCRNMPAGMAALGGPGYGVFEISEDLVGFEYLAYMQADDPELFAALYRRIGDLMVGIWGEFLTCYADRFAVCRMGDDLGFKSSTLVSPATIREHVLPQYGRILALVKQAHKPFLWHSCGRIFPVMEDVISLGINAKHSNEDAISPFETWIDLYGKRIGLLGGIDVDILCRQDPRAIYEQVLERGARYRDLARGYALGSGNSIPEYVPVEGYLAMVRAAQDLRGRDTR
jgi:uroporphyrinogen decarboxylase